MSPPSTPHVSPSSLVGVTSALVSYLSFRCARRSDGFPGRPIRWPRIAVSRFSETLRRRNRETAVWLSLLLWSALVSTLHFGGLEFGLYTRFYWWDLLTHGTSGVGVAVLLQLTFPGKRTSNASAGWIVPAVLSIGAGFEVYEFLFKTFWYTWSPEFYLTDTLLDLCFAGIGALAAVALTNTYLPRDVELEAAGTPLSALEE